ncbi:MAG: SurA N-terminal domain-containing protein [Bacteroidaceae bacterium]|nr:SurA N-terminal domain-containing protein [Bacteroidaceae bacterium]
MATLQKIRSMGPLLVIVISLGLFAFIAGDAWKVLAPHQSRDVGEVDGETISAQEYQTMIDEYTDVIKLSRGISSLDEEQTNQVNDQVWEAYVNSKLIGNEAKKIGLVVTTEEIQSILDAGVNPLLRQTPFSNPKTGMFDKDMLNKFLVEYSKMGQSHASSQYVEQYTKIYKYWNFIEKTLEQSCLADKYQALISQALISNPVEAKDAFDARVNQSNLLMAAIPYTSIPDSTIKIKDSDIDALYKKKKENFKQYEESRHVKYVDVQVKASAEDRAAMVKEMVGYTHQLDSLNNDYANFIRSTGSSNLFVDLYFPKSAFPADVVARIDSVTMGAVYGPYYNSTDNTFNSFKVLAKENAPDSIQYRQIQIPASSVAKGKSLADSVYDAVKAGADFTTLAKKYGQTGEETWISSAQYKDAHIEGDNLKYITAINNAEIGNLVILKLTQGSVIFQITQKIDIKDKYKIAVLKLPLEFSKETYNKAYNAFSQFIASNTTVNKLAANAESAGYELLDRADLYSSSHGIGGIKNTKEALRWVFAAKSGSISNLYECGDNDRMLVVAMVGVNPKGYRSIERVKPQLQAELLVDKKAEKIIASMKAAHYTTFTQYESLPNVVTDSVQHVTFAAPAYVASLRSSEPLIGSFASVAKNGELSMPIKGTAGVFVLQKYEEDKLESKFDVKQEEATIESMNARLASRLVNDLYLKANVKDKRYLFF